MASANRWVMVELQPWMIRRLAHMAESSAAVNSICEKKMVFDPTKDIFTKNAEEELMIAKHLKRILGEK